MPNQKLLPKIARLALESVDTPSLAYVWSKGNANLLISGEINLPYSTAQGIISSIISYIDELWASSGTHLDTVEETLENILVSLNQLLARLFSPYPFNPSAPRYHLIIAFFRHPEICLASIGIAGAFIISPTRFTNIIKSSQIAEGESPPPVSKKPLFTQIVTGKIRADESLVLTNPSILEYFSIEQLKQIINGNVPGQAVLIINNLIKNLDKQPPVSLIILKIQSTIQNPASATSIQHIIDRQTLTANILNPSWLLSLTNKLKLILTPSAKKSKSSLNKQPLGSLTPNKFNNGRSKIINLIKTARRIQIPWQRSEIKTQITNGLAQVIMSYRHLSQPHRVLLNIIIVLIFIFSFSVVTTGKNGLSLKNNALFQQLSSEINQKIGEIEATAIYQDEQKLSDLIMEAQNLLNQLPQKNNEQQKQFQALQIKIGNLAARSLKQIIIDQPTLVADLDKSNHDWQGIIFNQNLLAFASDGTIASLLNGQINTVITLPPETRPLTKAYFINDQRSLFISSNNINTIFNSIQDQFSIASNNIPKIIDAAAFEGDRLYILSDNPRYIYRANIDNKNISGLTSWLRQPDVVPDAVSLTVDGAIYVLKANTIEKYVRGTKRNFNYLINPSLKIADQIYTENSDSPLYILEKSAKRIVVLSKEGVLIRQFLLPTLPTIKDIVVKNNIIYVFDGHKVYQILEN